MVCGILVPQQQWRLRVLTTEQPGIPKRGAFLAAVGRLPGGQVVKRQETWVQSLGQKDLLEKEMATHSSILAW